MPQHKSCEKRVRQNERRRVRNVQKRTKLKTSIKKVKNTPDKETAVSELKQTISFLDKLAGIGIIHKNKAANLKSKLTKSVNKL